MKTISRAPKPHKVQVPMEVFQGGLSELGVTSTNQFAFLKLEISCKSLESIEGIQTFPHLQHVNLSNNLLKTVKSLSSLKHLLTLDVSFNQLSSLSDLLPPVNLLSLNASNNQFKSTLSISKHFYLQRLSLDHNTLTQIEGLEGLPNLQFLSLSHNKITRISGIPVSLQGLNLSHNEIVKIGGGFKKSGFLRVLDLSCNKLSSLRGTSDLENLMVLVLSSNNFKKINTLDHLVDLAVLSDLDLSDNQVTSKKHYRLRVAFKLPQLRRLDSGVVSAEEKIKAENLYGLDVEDRRALFNQIFPGQIFTDRRLEKSEMLDIESESEEDEEVSVKSKPDSKYVTRSLSKNSSRADIDPVARSEIIAFSKRYVGEMIEKEEQEKNTRVNFEVYE
jgi:hypothetical protein